MTDRRKTCAECFGPRSRYSKSFFCHTCENKLFGWGRYFAFIHNERTRNGMRAAAESRKALD